MASTSIQSEPKRKKLLTPNIELPIPSNIFTSGRGIFGQLGPLVISNRFTLVSNVPATNYFVQIAAGELHTSCLSSQGEVYTFGCNVEGALGRHTSRIHCFLPAKVPINGEAVKISAGDAHTAALMKDGRVLIWGLFRDSIGAMRDKKASIDKFLIPRPVEVPEPVIQLASGANHILLLTVSGKVFSAGCPDFGQLGRLSMRTATRDTRFGLQRLLKPGVVHIKGCHFFTDVWATQQGSFVRDKKMGIYAFGLNDYGQLGLKRTDGYVVLKPLKSLLLSDGHYNWVKIVGGTSHTILLDTSGRVYSIGQGENGRLGLGENTGDVSKPTLITALLDKKIVDIGCGNAVSYAVADDGVAFSWGWGSDGQLGTGEYGDILVPQKIVSRDLTANSLKILQVDGGKQHAVLLASY